MVTTDIGWAVEQLRQGKKVTREGWNGKGQYLELREFDQYGEMDADYVFIVTVNDGRVPWTCSQTDLLATDWMPA